MINNTIDMKKNPVEQQVVGVFGRKPMRIIIFFLSTLFAPSLHSQCTVEFLQCPTDTTVYNCGVPPGQLLITAYPPVSAYLKGNCAGYTLNLRQIFGPTLPAAFPNGTWLLGWRGEAQLNGVPTGIYKDCTLSFSVATDPLPPVFTYCPPSITVNGVLDANGNCMALGLWPVPIVSDICDKEVDIGLQSDTPCGGILGTGTHVITYTATDGAGNSSTCSFSVTVNCPSNTENPRELAYMLRLFPNPNTGAFTLELPAPAAQGTTIRVADPTGRLTLEATAEVGSERQQVQAGALPAGMYFLQVLQSGRVVGVSRFVKQ